eukprot:GHVS01019061.1.p1 GENE.GHVS01019061.1~~GHVS01019061.1.p1  ORF type:complete len:201 (+),score=32.50 GHVS01019061.1:470-1072(+)
MTPVAGIDGPMARDDLQPLLEATMEKELMRHKGKNYQLRQKESNGEEKFSFGFPPVELVSWVDPPVGGDGTVHLQVDDVVLSHNVLLSGEAAVIVSKNANIHTFLRLEKDNLVLKITDIRRMTMPVYDEADTNSPFKEMSNRISKALVQSFGSEDKLEGGETTASKEVTLQQALEKAVQMVKNDYVDYLNDMKFEELAAL